MISIGFPMKSPTRLGCGSRFAVHHDPPGWPSVILPHAPRVFFCFVLRGRRALKVCGWPACSDVCKIQVDTVLAVRTVDTVLAVRTVDTDDGALNNQIGPDRQGAIDHNVVDCTSPTRRGTTIECLVYFLDVTTSNVDGVDRQQESKKENDCH
mgnify:CR=1 FL=1